MPLSSSWSSSISIHLPQRRIVTGWCHMQHAFPNSMLMLPKQAPKFPYIFYHSYFYWTNMQSDTQNDTSIYQCELNSVLQSRRRPISARPNIEFIYTVATELKSKSLGNCVFHRRRERRVETKAERRDEQKEFEPMTTNKDMCWAPKGEWKRCWMYKYQSTYETTFAKTVK